MNTVADSAGRRLAEAREFNRAMAELGESGADGNEEKPRLSLEDAIDELLSTWLPAD